MSKFYKNGCLFTVKGNEMAHLGHYPAAIELFSEAIKLDPKDFRWVCDAF